MSRAERSRKGYTLLETVIALGVWAALAASVVGLLAYTTRMSARVTASGEVFENARASLDALITNIQLADTVEIRTDYDGVLRQLTLTELDPDGKPKPYYFYFSRSAQPGTAKYHRLEFGLNDEFASHIASVVLVYSSDKYITVTVTTDDEKSKPMTFSASVDARHKTVKVIYS